MLYALHAILGDGLHTTRTCNGQLIRIQDSHYDGVSFPIMFWPRHNASVYTYTTYASLIICVLLSYVIVIVITWLWSRWSSLAVLMMKCAGVWGINEHAIYLNLSHPPTKSLPGPGCFLSTLPRMCTGNRRAQCNHENTQHSKVWAPPRSFFTGSTSSHSCAGESYRPSRRSGLPKTAWSIRWFHRRHATFWQKEQATRNQDYFNTRNHVQIKKKLFPRNAGTVVILTEHKRQLIVDKPCPKSAGEKNKW